jgi:hypothetical protein
MIVYSRDDDETAALTARALGISEVEVCFMLAVGRGERPGDVVEVDDRGPRARLRRDRRPPFAPDQPKRKPQPPKHLHRKAEVIAARKRRLLVRV